jgi:hypothetical protein
MRICKSTKILKTLFPVMLLLLVAACTPAGQTAISPDVQKLIDKTAIEDLVIEYYSQLGTGGKGFADYYVEDSVLDVDGMVAKGRREVADLYKAAGADPEAPTARGGSFRMMLTNILITVNGDSAKGDMLWVGLHAAEPKALPVIIEHGRENAEFVKRDGQWYYKFRMITSDSGLDGIFVETYVPR